MVSQSNYSKKFDRWVSKIELQVKPSVKFSFKITIHDQNGAPSTDCMQILDEFTQNIGSYWQSIWDKLCELNSENTYKEIEASIAPVLHVFSPGTIDAKQYELMVLIDLKSKDIQEQSCAFCFDDQELVFCEKYI
jgi:hypothetical protein